MSYVQVPSTKAKAGARRIVMRHSRRSNKKYASLSNKET